MLQIIDKSVNLLLTLAYVKGYLKVTHDSENSLIEDLIRYAQNYIEDYTSRAITNNTYKYLYDTCDDINYIVAFSLRIQKGFITEIVSIKTYDTDQSETVYDVADFDIINADQYSKIVQKDQADFPIGSRGYNPLVVDFKAGFTTTTLPYDLRTAICKLVASYYEYRETMSPENMTEIPHGVIDILEKHRLEYF